MGRNKYLLTQDVESGIKPNLSYFLLSQRLEGKPQTPYADVTPLQ